MKYFGPKAVEPFDIVEQDWTAEEIHARVLRRAPWCRAWTQYGKALAAPVGRIHWAGAEMAQQWSGYMDGARQAADEILADV